MRAPDLLAPSAIIAWRGEAPVTRAQFFAQAAALAATLPDAPAINICEDRYRFMLAFAALLLRGQPNLLPPSTAPAALAQIAAAHAGAYLMADQAMPEAGLPLCWFEEPAFDTGLQSGHATWPPPAGQLAAIAYTSGSTGTPQGHAKTWGELEATVQLSTARLFGAGAVVNLVGTVPPQHLYGLEFTVTAALAAGCRATAGKPFFPQDLARALNEVPAPRVLVTTPLHLRACLKAGVALPELAGIVCATAPLDAATAAQAEARYGAPLREIYGCTEAGSLASRRTAVDDIWQLHEGASFAARAADADAESGTRVDTPHLSSPVLLQDDLQPLDATRFRLLGRGTDLIKVAGKRASLSELNALLLATPGVEDAAVFLPPTDGEARPAALVVAPALERAEILARLAERIDPVLLPRPLLKLPRLPRNALGKLPQAELIAALRAAQERGE